MILQKGLVFLSSILFLHAELSLSKKERRIDPETQKRIDDFVNNVFLPQAHAQGLGLSIMQNDGELLYTTGYGFANIEEGIPNGNDTQFGIGSVSKGFSALVVVKALHEHLPDMGESVLDTPIVKLVPQMNVTFIDRFRSEHITVRDLLAHRHCLDMDWFTIAAEAINTREEALYRQRYLNQICAFRTGLAYTNAMVTLAGEVAAAVANKSFDDLAKEMFDALQMNNSAFIKASDDFSQIPGRAKPYYVSNDVPHPYNADLPKRLIPFNPAGGLFSTPNDMMRYLNFILRHGELDGKQIVPRKVIEWMMKPSNYLQLASYKGKEGDKPFSQFAYGLGLMISSYDGWQMLEHGGSNPPYSAQIAIYPEENLVVFMALHEGPEVLSRIVLPLFIFDTLNGDSNAEKVAIGRMKDEKKKTMIKEMDNFYEPRKDSGEILAKLKEDNEKMKVQGQLLSPIIGSYGSGAMGDLHLMERFNSESNQTEFYLHFGKWYQGWLHADPRYPGMLYSVELETEIWHDFHGAGIPHAVVYLQVLFNHLPKVAVFVSDANLSFIMLYAEFLYGNGLDALPVIPWEPDSCGI